MYYSHLHPDPSISSRGASAGKLHQLPRNDQNFKNSEEGVFDPDFEN
jgi:hypothetical protein